MTEENDFRAYLNVIQQEIIETVSDSPLQFEPELYLLEFEVKNFHVVMTEVREQTLQKLGSVDSDKNHLKRWLAAEAYWVVEKLKSEASPSNSFFMTENLLNLLAMLKSNLKSMTAVREHLAKYSANRKGTKQVNVEFMDSVFRKHDGKLKVSKVKDFLSKLSAEISTGNQAMGNQELAIDYEEEIPSIIVKFDRILVNGIQWTDATLRKNICNYKRSQPDKKF